MGSITSTPRLPVVQPQPVYIQAPAPVTAPVYTPPSSITAPASGGASGGTASATPADIAAAATPQGARSAGLLERSRGIFSTVLTGFRGLLNDTPGAAPRKTLLGE